MHHNISDLLMIVARLRMYMDRGLEARVVIYRCTMALAGIDLPHHSFAERASAKPWFRKAFKPSGLREPVALRAC
jgi:hypothetical protein